MGRGGGGGRAAGLAGRVDGWIDEARADWKRRRPRVAGRPDLLESIADNIMWTVLLQPETGRLYVPAGRRWIFPKARAVFRPGGGDPVPGATAAPSGTLATSREPGDADPVP